MYVYIYKLWHSSKGVSRREGKEYEEEEEEETEEGPTDQLAN